MLVSQREAFLHPEVILVHSALLQVVVEQRLSENQQSQNAEIFFFSLISLFLTFLRAPNEQIRPKALEGRLAPCIV